MRIGFYHDAAGTRHAGGIAVYTQRVAAALSRRHEVFVYTQSGDLTGVLAEADVRVVETPSFDERLPGTLRALSPLGEQDLSKLAMATWAARNGVFDHVEDHVDVLVTFQFLDDLLVSNLVDVPTVYGYHSLENVGVGARLRERFARTDHEIANSADTARRVADTFGREVDAVVPPGVDADAFHPDAEPAFDRDVPTVLFVGRLVEEKGVFDLLAAVAGLDEPAEVVVVGAGDEAAVRRRCDELGIADRVTLAGEVPHVELPGYYAAATVFCLPTRAESFGMANLEAMACGTPVITSNLRGTETYLSNGENGLLARAGDPADVADKLRMLLSSPALRRRLGENARETALAFTWEAQARRLERFCADVLDAELPADETATDAAHPRLG